MREIKISEIEYGTKFWLKSRGCVEYVKYGDRGRFVNRNMSYLELQSILDIPNLMEMHKFYTTEDDWEEFKKEDASRNLCSCCSHRKSSPLNIVTGKEYTLKK